MTALTMWTFPPPTKPSVVISGLATEWAVDDADKKKWTFKLRPASPSTMVRRSIRRCGLECRESAQAGYTAIRSEPGRRDRVANADLASAARIDDMTVEMTTKEPDSFLPINLTNLFMASPAKWQKLFDAAEGRGCQGEIAGRLGRVRA